VGVHVHEAGEQVEAIGINAPCTLQVFPDLGYAPVREAHVGGAVEAARGIQYVATTYY
jgi:hypothetical protein